MYKAQEAVTCFQSGFNCCQAVFSTYSPEFGLDKDTALKIASSFGGGIGRMGETCGTVTAALMLIGLKNGNIDADNKQAKEANYQVVHDFIDKFIQLHGSVKCKDLLNCDISTPDGHEKAKEQKLFSTLCYRYVEDSALLIEEIMSES